MSLELRQPKDDIATATGRIRAAQHPLDAMLFHPLAERLARLLSKTPVSPNMVSFAGGLAIVIAAIAYLQQAWPWSALLGFAIHSLWHVLDGADGDLARMTGKASPSGEIFDGICDYSGHILLYLMLAYAASPALGWSALGLALAAGASRIVQANFYETQKRQYLDWVHGVAWLRTKPCESIESKQSTLGQAYLKLADYLVPRDAVLEQALSEPGKAGPLKQRLTQFGPQALYGSDLLGAPYRTIALALSMLAGSPVWYFLFEIIILNMVLWTSIRRTRRTLADLAQAH
ncbi:CDP-alcohol phosphatidyltransferase family protein [Altererythrobacter sp. GH1-8]|uniref:CDP-alcohol phosphatidyltransferase family protein n=1 Tax=Altererythrobacter sp. GH1-8 TaxID=3349333 RepID=UPI00374D1FF0